MQQLIERNEKLRPFVEEEIRRYNATLNEKSKGTNEEPKKINFNSYKYLQMLCELKIRKILEKYYKGEDLNPEDEDIMGKYSLFSDLSSPNEPSVLEVRLKYTYGSGDFTYEEIRIINKLGTKNTYYK